MSIYPRTARESNLQKTAAFAKIFAGAQTKKIQVQVHKNVSSAPQVQNKVTYIPNFLNIYLIALTALGADFPCLTILLSGETLPSSTDWPRMGFLAPDSAIIEIIRKKFQSLQKIHLLQRISGH